MSSLIEVGRLSVYDLGEGGHTWSRSTGPSAVAQPSRSQPNPANLHISCVACIFEAYPELAFANNLTYFTGCRLPEVLRGECGGDHTHFRIRRGSGGNWFARFTATSPSHPNSQYRNTRDPTEGWFPKSQDVSGRCGLWNSGLEPAWRHLGTAKVMVKFFQELSVPVKYTFPVGFTMFRTGQFTETSPEWAKCLQ